MTIDEARDILRRRDEDEARKILSCVEDDEPQHVWDLAEALRVALAEVDRLREAERLALDDNAVCQEGRKWLRAEVDRLRKDAERYRWLRGGPEIPPHSTRWPRWEVRYWDGRYWQTLFSDNLDTAIDAEISNNSAQARREASPGAQG